MKEQLLTYRNKLSETWQQWTAKQRSMVVGIIIFLVLSTIFMFYWASRPEFTQIYTNLSPAESGEIVQEIEARGIPVQISPDGRTVSVPKASANRLKIELASQGIPRSGNINYSFFSENVGFGGMTDKQFDVVKQDAMQNELRYLIEQIDGIDQARVMINVPNQSPFIVPDQQSSTASVVIHVRQGLQLSPTQINGLFHLISRTVPNLPPENITIMNQYFHTYDLENNSPYNSSLTAYEFNRQVKRDIEKDIQRDLHLLLGTILGMDRVVISVQANVDFTKVRSQEHLVQPVDVVNNEGIAISIERIQEAYTGEGSGPGGIAGTGGTDIGAYTGVDGSQNSEYERLEERINNEVNRIYREVESNPYVIEDLVINVGVEPPNPLDPTSLTEQEIDDIRAILGSVVRTYLSSSSVDLTQPGVIDQRVTVFASEFRSRPYADLQSQGLLSNNLIYILAGLLVLAIATTAFVLVRRKKTRQEEELAFEEVGSNPTPIQDYDFDQENEETIRRKRIERLARNKPDEFVKLLRTWLSDE